MTTGAPHPRDLIAFTVRFEAGGERHYPEGYTWHIGDGWLHIYGLPPGDAAAPIIRSIPAYRIHDVTYGPGSRSRNHGWTTHQLDDMIAAWHAARKDTDDQPA